MDKSSRALKLLTKCLILLIKQPAKGKIIRILMDISQLKANESYNSKS